MNRYSSISVLKNTNENVGSLGTPYYNSALYPEIPLSEDDIYVITDFGDRLDMLANQFYNDITLYWVISAANPNKLDFGSIFIPEGTQLRIPTNISSIIDSFIQINSL